MLKEGDLVYVEYNDVIAYVNKVDDYGCDISWVYVYRKNYLRWYHRFYKNLFYDQSIANRRKDITNLKLLNSYSNRQEYNNKITEFIDNYDQAVKQKTRGVHNFKKQKAIKHYKSIRLRYTQKWLCIKWVYAITSTVLLYVAWLYTEV